MTKTSKVVLAVLAVFVFAVGGGYLGAGMRGGNAAASGGGQSAGAFLDAIKKRGELRVGVALAPPMIVQNADGTMGGPNLIPLRNLAEKMGVKFTLVTAQWSNLVSGLQAGRYDFAADLDYTVERSLSIQFTDPVYKYQGVFVISGSAKQSTSTEVLNAGQPIATGQGTAPEAVMKALGAKILSLDTLNNAVQSVKAGRALAEFTDLPMSVAQTHADSSLKIIVPSPQLYSASAGYGVPANTDARSLQTINIAIDRAVASGEMDAAYAKVDYREIDKLGDLQK